MGDTDTYTNDFGLVDHTHTHTHTDTDTPIHMLIHNEIDLRIDRRINL